MKIEKLSLNELKITDDEFELFRAFIYDQAGLKLNGDKKPLVLSRLSRRLRHYSIDTFKEYFDLVVAPGQHDECQVVIDLLTTNETYFFREPRHFAFMEREILPKWQGGRTFRVWSAASSTGVCK